MGKNITKYIFLTILLFISSLNFNFFMNPAKIVSGGTNGLTVLGQYYFDFSPAIIMFAFSILFLLISLIFDQYKLMISAIYSSLIYPFFIGLTENIANIIRIEYSNMILIALFSGIITGVISGTICKLGLSQGGVILFCQTLYTKLKISISKSNTLINATIVIAGGFAFGINTVLYSLIFIYSSKFAMDRIMLGISEQKIFYIMTEEVDKVSEYIKTQLNSGCTIFNAKGGYNNKNLHVIMTSVPTREYFKLKEGIHEIDKKSFFVITDSYEVKGGK